MIDEIYVVLFFVAILMLVGLIIIYGLAFALLILGLSHILKIDIVELLEQFEP